MRKIRLKLDTLTVDSFPTAAAPAGTGTVEGHQISIRLGCATRDCPTAYISCEGGCTNANMIC